MVAGKLVLMSAYLRTPESSSTLYRKSRPDRVKLVNLQGSMINLRTFLRRHITRP